jgi:AraC-like DNA-binding protein
MSRASLYNKVKALTGMGVNDYIIRIERSVYLLTNTDMSINDISYEVGFSYPRYFSTSFKQMKGMTPTRFKEENKKKSQP